MAKIKLTQTAWQDRELARVRAVLTHQLTRDGIDEQVLARLLKRYLAAEYTGTELAWFKEQLINEGIIEEA